MKSANIIGTQQTTLLLGEALATQGPATPSGGWATLTPLINPDAGQPYRNSQGQIQYMPQWSQETSEFAGQAMLPALDTVKDEPSLGVNITAIDPTTITTNDANAPTKGALWTLHDGRPAVDQSAGGGLAGSGLGYQLTDQTPADGYSLAVTGVDPTLNVSVEAKNWFLRYLGLYIRYLDAKGQPIPLSALANDIQDKFDFWQAGQNGEFDAFLGVVNPEFAVLGISVETTTITRTFPLPPAATSALILAGGLGHGDNTYPATINPGAALTIVVNLTVPAFFLALAIATAYPIFVQQIQAAADLKVLIQLVVFLVQDLTLEFEYGSVTWKTLAVQLGQVLLNPAAAALMQLIAGDIATGEVTDTVPIVGIIISAVIAVSLVAQIVKTAVEVGNSPRTYVNELTFTHDIAVTIHHDPKDPAGFPFAAASYRVTAQFDKGTSFVIAQPMPGGGATVSDPITRFPACPSAARSPSASGSIRPTAGWPARDRSGRCPTPRARARRWTARRAARRVRRPATSPCHSPSPRTW